MQGNFLKKKKGFIGKESENYLYPCGLALKTWSSINGLFCDN